MSRNRQVDVQANLFSRVGRIFKSYANTIGAISFFCSRQCSTEQQIQPSESAQGDYERIYSGHCARFSASLVCRGATWRKTNVERKLYMLRGAVYPSMHEWYC